MARKEGLGNEKLKGKKTKQGASNMSKGNKKYKGQGGPRKRFKWVKKF